jgi:hypothetical protein
MTLKTRSNSHLKTSITRLFYALVVSYFFTDSLNSFAQSNETELNSTQIKVDAPLIVNTEDGSTLQTYGFKIDPTSAADVAAAQEFIAEDVKEMRKKNPKLKVKMMNVPVHLKGLGSRLLLAAMNAPRAANDAIIENYVQYQHDVEYRKSTYISVARIGMNSSAQYYSLTLVPNMSTDVRLKAAFMWIGSFCAFTAFKHVHLGNYITQGSFTADVQNQNLPLDYRAPLTRAFNYMSDAVSKKVTSQNITDLTNILISSGGIVGQVPSSVVSSSANSFKKFRVELAPSYERFAQVEAAFLAGIIVGLSEIYHVPTYVNQEVKDLVIKTLISIAFSTVAQGSFDIGTGEYRKWAVTQKFSDAVISRNMKLMGVVSSLLSVTGAVLASAENPNVGNIMLGALFGLGVGTQYVFKNYDSLEQKLGQNTPSFEQNYRNYEAERGTSSEVVNQNIQWINTTKATVATTAVLGTTMHLIVPVLVPDAQPDMALWGVKALSAAWLAQEAASFYFRQSKNINTLANAAIHQPKDFCKVILLGAREAVGF